jgi:hypothetical protein
MAGFSEMGYVPIFDAEAKEKMGTSPNFPITAEKRGSRKIRATSAIF